jgi:hypothetical protein
MIKRRISASIATLLVAGAVSLVPSGTTQGSIGSSPFSRRRPNPPLIEEVFRYYNTCGSGRYVVGEEQWPCDGTYSSWGATSNYLEVIETNCSTGHVTHYYQECNVAVSSLDTCTC